MTLLRAEIERAFDRAGVQPTAEIAEILSSMGELYKNAEIEQLDYDIGNLLALGSQNFSGMSTEEKINTLINEAESFRTRYKKHTAQGKTHLEELYDMLSKSQHKKEGFTGKLPHFSGYIQSTYGLKPGYSIIAGDSNVGKTAKMLNIAIDYIEYNDDKDVIFITLDDDRSVISQRCISLLTAKHSNLKHAVKINEVDAMQDSPENESQRRRSFMKFNDFVADKRFRCLTKADVQNFSDIKDIIQRSERPIILMTDAVYKMRNWMSYKDTVSNDDALADVLDDIANEFKVHFLTVMNLKKDRKGSVPTKDDIKGSTNYHYNAKYVGMLYPKDQKDFQSGVDKTVKYFVDKNKMSDYFPRINYDFIKEFSFMRELDEYNL